MGTEWLDLWSERPELGLRSPILSLRSDLRSKKLDMGLEMPNFRV